MGCFRHRVYAAGAIAALLLLVPPFGAAQEQSARATAAACATCHGTRGMSNTAIPSLAGRDADELYRLLNEFKTDQRPGTVMNQHAKAYSDPELRQLADYFAAQQP